MERILIKFTKNNEARFISHLDTMRTLQRAFRRAGIKVAYSKGYNPHPSLSIAAPLSLGISSNGEYADVELSEYIPQEEFIKRLNEQLPQGIQVLKVIYIEKKLPPSMSAVMGAEYHIKLKHNLKFEDLTDVVNRIMSSKEIIKEKKTKTGVKMVNIRPLIRDIAIKAWNVDSVVFKCYLCAGSRYNLNPEIIVDVLKEYSENRIYGFPEIVREDIYSIEDEKWIVLDEYFSGK
ncbi:TIGR03936 family radical SAM-associated protein [Fonticella tunisiensis]|uniref:Radical SAM-linked protein n=1 Tax=Fonticella tunisiensis TaxID=1096341 RepID=A0A4R7KTI8_9CLOT|nr:TIGR03936 family radical SAM-associated protein [Fonticella tunisiensis]TDT61208.1 radical SAM-linked protein [Fonticella tunisiensis]